MTDLLTRSVGARLTDALPVEADGDHDAPASALAGSLTGQLAMGVAPSTGRFRPEVVPGQLVAEGEYLGAVTGGGGRADALYAPAAGEVSALLAHAGQLVAKGRALVWLQRMVQRVPGLDHGLGSGLAPDLGTR